MLLRILTFLAIPVQTSVVLSPVTITYISITSITDDKDNVRVVILNLKSIPSRQALGS